MVNRIIGEGAARRRRFEVALKFRNVTSTVTLQGLRIENNIQFLNPPAARIENSEILISFRLGQAVYRW